LAEEAKSTIARALHNYMVPDYVYMMPGPLPTDAAGEIDEVQLRKDLSELQGASMEKLEASIEGRVTQSFCRDSVVSS
jgi:hypothetical protein